MKTLEKTRSICPECFRKDNEVKELEAEVVEEDGSVYIKKECDKHGSFKSIVFSDYEDYKRWDRHKQDGDGIEDVHVENLSLYDGHNSQSVLTNLTITNRCNLRCSYCFANAGSQGFVYEPSLDKIQEMIDQARSEKPVPSKAIQITGGEPTVRDDLFEIIDMAKEAGFAHIQLNTNAIKLADSKEYCKKILDHGVNTIYMSFDGVTKETNPWIEQNKQAIQNLREIGFTSVVLVPVAMQDNIDEIEDIIEFAKDNIDVVRGVNIQPIAFTGRIENIDDDYRKNERVDYSTLMEKIEEDSDGQIAKNDWYPVPFVYPISKLVENVKDEKQVEFTAHPSCGGATYVFMDGDEMVPITRFLDVEGFMELVDKLSKKKGKLKKAKIAASMMNNLSKFIDKEKAPEGFSLKKLLVKAITKGDYSSLGEFHYKTLYVGTMWFQDVWNLNLDRLQNCVIHYTTPEGMVPFCAYNGLGVGQEIREKHSIPVEKWEEKSGKTLKDDLWKNGPVS
ncbi:MAG: tetraether lipid synthase Tes [Candidatus Aenigmatarchaeota archaeon]